MVATSQVLNTYTNLTLYQYTINILYILTEPYISISDL